MKRPASPRGDDRALLDLDGIGKAMLGDLHRLGVHDVRRLARQHPQALYDRLGRLSGVRQNPCEYSARAVARCNSPSAPRSVIW